MAFTLDYCPFNLSDKLLKLSKSVCGFVITWYQKENSDPFLTTNERQTWLEVMMVKYPQALVKQTENIDIDKNTFDI